MISWKPHGWPKREDPSDLDPRPMETFQADQTDAGQRFDIVVSRRIGRLSRARVQSLIESGYIRLNSEEVRVRQRVQVGDWITVTEPEPQPVGIVPQSIALPILYEDLYLVVINKPAGLTVHPGAGRSDGTLVNALFYHCSSLSGIGGELRPGVVHRLDKETSGCLVVAKDDLTHQDLSRQFASRKVEKYYLALCQGKFSTKQGEILAPIGRHPVYRKKMAIVERGRSARTLFEVLQEVSDFSLVLCRLFSGRTHQIRVHMQHLGHPIVGDKLYGRHSRPFERHMLHAWRLGFTHPVMEKWFEFEAEIPQEFVALGVNANELTHTRNRISH
jgi:23S rRNA pseudouridine1911/1915/1917 synthase